MTYITQTQQNHIRDQIICAAGLADGDGYDYAGRWFIINTMNEPNGGDDVWDTIVHLIDELIADDIKAEPPMGYDDAIVEIAADIHIEVGRSKFFKRAVAEVAALAEGDEHE